MAKFSIILAKKFFTKAKLKFVHAILVFILAKFNFILAKLTWTRYRKVWRKGKNLICRVFAAGESGENGGKLKLPDWLMSMFICSCFIADSFPLQAKAIDCMLQQFVLSSTQSAELAFSEDQSIIPSITRRQLAVIKHSYNLFLVSALP